VSATWPDAAQLETFLAAPQDEPVVMMNLLRLKSETEDLPPGESARDVMMRYAEPMRQHVEAHGGEFVFAGDVASQLIGHGGEDFAFVSIMRYPSRRVFLELAGDPEIAETIGKHRDVALESQWLLVMTEAPR
jgi:uncharacterized protein (DUF1330 family)